MAKPEAYPLKPAACEGGYFLIVDVTKCKDLIPSKYLESHDYLSEEDRVATVRINMPDGRVPLDMAFCRWMACEKGLTMMPGCLFYDANSPGISDKYVRIGICKTFEATKESATKLLMK